MEYLLPDIMRHISNEIAYPIYPLNPCDGLHPLVTRCCSDFQDTISSAGSCDFPSPGLTFNLCIGFEMLAQQVNIADCDHQVLFFCHVSPSIVHHSIPHQYHLGAPVMSRKIDSSTRSTKHFKSKNRRDFSGGSLYHVKDKRTADSAQRLYVYHTLNSKMKVWNKKEKNHD
jgi:hypothetical protein